MSQTEPTILGLTAAQFTSLAKRAVTEAVQSDVQAGIAVTGFVDGKVQTLEPSDQRLSKFRQDDQKADGIHHVPPPTESLSLRLAGR